MRAIVSAFHVASTKSDQAHTTSAVNESTLLGTVDIQAWLAEYLRSIAIERRAAPRGSTRLKGFFGILGKRSRNH